MKSLFTVSWLLLSCVSLYAQTPIATILPIDTQTHRVTFTEVVAVEGIKQSELYTRAKLWLALTFDDAKDVIKVDEKEAGLLLIKAYTDLPVKASQADFEPHNLEVGYQMMLNFKDGRYKYTLTNYQVLFVGTSVSLEKEISTQLSRPKNKGVFLAKQYEEQVAAYAKSLTESLNATLHKSVTGENDW